MKKKSGKTNKIFRKLKKQDKDRYFLYGGGLIILIAVVFFLVNMGEDVQIGDTPAETGDYVEVIYVGMLGDGTVFDTNIEQIALRENLDKAFFEPIQFTIGAGQVIPGFEEAVVGMKLNEERTVVIPPEKAYGMRDETNVFTRPRIDELNRTMEIDRTLTMDLQTFAAVFGKEAVVGEVVSTDQVPWSFTVESIGVDAITITINAKINDVFVIPGTPWNSTVTGVTNEKIILRQDPVEGSIIRTQLGEAEVSVTRDKIIIKANPELGTSVITQEGRATVVYVDETSMTLDFNHYLAGKELTFELKLVTLQKAR